MSDELYTINGLVDLVDRDRITIKRIITRMDVEPDGKRGNWDAYKLETFQEAAEAYAEQIGNKRRDKTGEPDERDDLINKKLQKEILRICEDIKRKSMDNQITAKKLMPVSDVFQIYRQFGDKLIDNLYAWLDQLPVNATGKDPVQLRKIYEAEKKKVVMSVVDALKEFRSDYEVNDIHTNATTGSISI
jgi:hypothetical protein